MDGKDGSEIEEQPAAHKPHPKESSINRSFILGSLTSMDLSGSYTFAPVSQDKNRLILVIGVSPLRSVRMASGLNGA